MLRPLVVDPRRAEHPVHLGNREKSDGHRCMGDSLLEQGRCAEAEEAYANMLGTAGDVDQYALGHMRRAQARLKRQDWGGALADAGRALVFSPGDPDALLLQGEACCGYGDAEGAIKWFQAARQAGPGACQRADRGIAECEQMKSRAEAAAAVLPHYLVDMFHTENAAALAAEDPLPAAVAPPEPEVTDMTAEDMEELTHVPVRCTARPPNPSPRRSPQHGTHRDPAPAQAPAPDEESGSAGQSTAAAPPAASATVEAKADRRRQRLVRAREAEVASIRRKLAAAEAAVAEGCAAITRKD